MGVQASHTCSACSSPVDTHSNRLHGPLPLQVTVSQHAECTMQLKILQETQGGGHKFKMSSVVVRATLPEGPILLPPGTA